MKEASKEAPKFGLQQPDRLKTQFNVIQNYWILWI